MRSTATIGAAHFSLWVLLAGAGSATAQTPSDPFNHSRKTTYAYDSATGRLVTTTVEPGQALLCSAEQRGYDGFGNVNVVETRSCSATRASIATRGISATFGAQAPQPITVDGVAATLAAPEGVFQTQATNALAHPTAMLSDPRTGQPTRVTDPNGAVVSISYDDFGRKLREVAPDGTRTAHWHCYLPAAGAGFVVTNTAGCPDASAQAPAPAVRFTHSEARSTLDVKMGPHTRTFFDGAGRVVRVVTESFDAATQPAAYRGAAVAQDTVYSEAGLPSLTTAAYFLHSGSTSTTGSNDVSAVATVYDALARAIAVRETRPAGPLTHVFGSGSNFGYGAYGSRAAIITRQQYSGLVQVTTDPDGRQSRQERSALGAVVRATDALQAQVAHLYDAFGQRVQTRDPLQNSIFWGYDLLGRAVRQIDPDRGVTTRCLDVLGQSKAEQTSAMRGNHIEQGCPSQADTGTTASAMPGWTTLAYDKLGRIRQVVSPSVIKAYFYDGGIGAIGQLNHVRLSTGVLRGVSYDGFGRKVSSRTDVGPAEAQWAESVAYDSQTGRVSEVVYPSGLRLRPGYTPLGFEFSATTATALNITPRPAVAGGAAAPPLLWPANTVLASLQRRDAAGKVEAVAFANGLVSTRAYDFAGRPQELSVGTAVSPGSVVRMSYRWRPDGILAARTDHVGDGSHYAVTEDFAHDELHRLYQYRVASPGISGHQRSVSMAYNAVGMLLAKSDVGAYEYGLQGAGLDRPHAPIRIGTAALGYDLNGNLTSATAGKYRSLTYNEFDRVVSAKGSSGVNYSWHYDEANQRIKEVRVLAGATRTTWYAGLLELEVNDPVDETKNRNRHTLRLAGMPFGTFISVGALPVPAGSGTAPIAASSLNGVRFEFQHRDMLQSLVATTDHAGTVTARMAYDPYGARRQTAGELDAAGSLVIDWNDSLNHGTGVGFTGHEELDEIGLVNANARLYDDRAGVFIQADPAIQAPDNTQNYGRYSYVFDNPLVLVDPSGMYAERQAEICHLTEHRCKFAEAEARWENVLLARKQAESIQRGEEQAARQKIAVDRMVANQLMGADAAEGAVAYYSEQNAAAKAWRDGLETSKAKFYAEAPDLTGELRFLASSACKACALADGAYSSFEAGSLVPLGLALIGAKGANQFVDLAPAARRHHILDGEVRANGTFGGGHRGGTGFPGKSEFPRGWSDDKVMHHISDVATDPLSVTRPGRGGDVFVRGKREGIEIEVLIRRGEIWTGYPVNVPKNP